MDEESKAILSLSAAMEAAGRSVFERLIEGLLKMKPVIAEMLAKFRNDPEFAKRIEKKDRHRRRYYRMMTRIQEKKGK